MSKNNQKEIELLKAIDAEKEAEAERQAAEAQRQIAERQREIADIKKRRATLKEEAGEQLTVAGSSKKIFK